MQSLNHHYRTIWSEALGAWIAVSEITKAKGKRSASSLIRSIRIDNSCRELSRSNTRLKPILFAVACCFSINALANPVGGTVVNGHATFATIGNTLTVTNTPGTIINWQNFSINANETTKFVQQSTTSSVLNRVTSANPSNILGSLQSNGRVFLVNPNGIVFGAGSTVDVGGLVATTLNLSNADFKAGRNNFTGGTATTGSVSNAGNIKASNGGQIYLIAPNVENNGIITSPNGEILLAAGNSVDLVSTTNPNLRVNITAPAGNVTNVGKLVASAGSLGLFGTIVQNTGVVSADSAVMQGGKIVFKSSQTTEISGTVSANGTTGGTIEALGPQVGVMDGAVVSANGTHGGGTVLIGGDAHGANQNVKNAQVTYFSPTASISANAQQNGNGGKVIVWADNATRAYGSISAMGGSQGGNGGYVETSGGYLDVYGIHVNTKAPLGVVGNWLLDPYDINIVSSGFDTSTLTGTNPVNAFSAVGVTGGSSNLNVLLIDNASSAITLQATHNINFNAAINMGNSPWSLTAQAGNNIVLNSNITTYGGAISLTANDSTASSASGSGSIIGSGILLTQGSGTPTTGSALITLATSGTGTIGTGTGTSAIHFASGEGSTAGVVATTTGGNVWLNGAGTLTLGAINTGTGQLNVSSTGLLTIGSTITSGIVSLTGTGVTNNSVITGSGGVTINAGTGLLNNGSGQITNGGGKSTAPISLTADTMSLSGNGGMIAAGAAKVNLATYTSTLGLSIGTLPFAGLSGGVSTTGILGFSTGTGGIIVNTNLNSTSFTSAVGGYSLSTTGTINETTGTITGVSLTTSSVGGTTLTGTNTITSFNATNSGGGAINLINSGPLTVTGISQSGGGLVSVTNTGSLSTSGLIASDGNVSLIAPGTSSDITVNGGINYTGTSTAGSLMIQAGRNISVFTAPIQSTGTQALNVTLGSNYGGTVGAVGAVGLFSGGNIFSNGGNITIGGGTGTISAGVGFAQGYDGVFPDGSASGNGVDIRANLTAAGGNIVINGIASSGSAFNPIGVSIGGNVSTTGAGTIVLNGQSTSPINSPYGVEIGNAGTGELSVNGSVTSVNGDILINGISGSTTQHGNIGLLLINNSTVQSTGTGNITLNGTAASTAPTTLGGGIDIQSGPLGNPSVLANSGNIVITSSTGSGMSLSNSTIASTSGNVTLTSNGGTISQTAGSISGRTLTTSSSGGTTLRGANSVASYIASNSVSGDITLTNAYNQFTLDTILNTGAAGNVVIDNTGGVIVAGALTTPGYLDLTAHSPITIASTGSINAGGAVSLVAGSPGSTSPADTITINGTIIGSTVTLAAHEVSGNIPANAIIDVYNGTAAIAPTVLDTLASVVAMLLNPSEFNLLLEGGSANDLSLLSLDEKKEAAANLAANDKLNNKFDSFTVKALPVCK